MSVWRCGGRLRAIVALAGVALGLVAAASPASAGTRVSAPVPGCRAVTIPVSLGDGKPVTDRISGELCLPVGRVPQTVQLLVHGAGYNRDYFSWPQNPGLYSYVRPALAAGFATLAIDRLGVGRSSRPEPNLVNTDTTISVLHQVTAALRAGGVGPRFARIVYVGHSFGSYYGLGLAATHGGAIDALLLTGSGRRVSPTFGAMAAAAFVPAVQVATRFAGLAPGWLAAKPSAVGPMHYDQATADPRVIAVDAERQEPVSADEFASRRLDLIMFMLRVGVPTLIVNGDRDIHYCAPDGMDCSSQAAFHTQLVPLFTARTCLRTALIPQTGHNLTLHRTAPLSAAVMLAWARQVAPPRGGAGGCPALHSGGGGR